MQRDLTEGSVLKNLLIFAVPYFIATFLQSFYGLVDLFVVGRFNGAEVISAVSSGSQVMHMVTVTIVGFAMGATVLIGRMVGEKNTEGRSRAIGTTITIFLLLAILLTAFLLLNLNHFKLAFCSGGGLEPDGGLFKSLLHGRSGNRFL